MNFGNLSQTELRAVRNSLSAYEAWLDWHVGIPEHWEYQAVRDMLVDVDKEIAARAQGQSTMHPNQVLRGTS